MGGEDIQPSRVSDLSCKLRWDRETKSGTVGRGQGERAIVEGGASCHSDAPMGTLAAELMCHSTAVTFMSHVLSFGLKQAFQQPW